jgi:Mn-dependent DtxR family transcriptional regulator
MYLRQDIIHTIIFEGEVTSSEISKELNQRPEVILDELRLLEREGLIRGDDCTGWIYFGTPISEPLGAYTCV